MRNALFLTALIVSFSLPLSESIKNLSFGALSLLWLVLVFRRQLRWPSFLTPLACAHLVLVAVAFVSATTAYDTYQGLRGAWDVLRAFLFFLILATAGFRSRRIYWILVALVGGVVVGSFWGFYDLITGAKYAFQIHSLGHENHTATYLVITQCIIVGFLLGSNMSRKGWALCVVSEVLVLFGIVFTQSRLALFTTVLVLLVFLLRARQTILLVLCGLLATLVYVLSTLRHRIRWAKPIYRFRHGMVTLWANPAETVLTNYRIQIWKESLRAVRKFPLLGVGPRNYTFLSEMGYPVRTNHAHSIYFNVAVEMGLIGFGALLVYLGTYFWAWRRLASRSREGIQSVLETAVLGAWLTMVISGLLTTTFHTEGAMLFTGLMGLFLAAVEADRFLNIRSVVESVLQPARGS